MRAIRKRQNDLQRVPPVGQCTRCGAELYPTGCCWRLRGQILCESCAVAWIREELAPYRVTWEEMEE